LKYNTLHINSADVGRPL